MAQQHSNLPLCTFTQPVSRPMIGGWVCASNQPLPHTHKTYIFLSQINKALNKSHSRSLYVLKFDLQTQTRRSLFLSFVFLSPSFPLHLFLSAQSIFFYHFTRLYGSTFPGEFVSYLIQHEQRVESKEGSLFGLMVLKLAGSGTNLVSKHWLSV